MEGLGLILTFISVSGIVYAGGGIAVRFMPTTREEVDRLLFSIFYRYHPEGGLVGRYFRYYQELLDKTGKKDFSPQAYMILKELTALLTFLAGIFLSGPLLSLLLAVAVFLYPDAKMRSQIEAEKEEMRRNFPYFVDLLAIVVESGVDFNSAVEKISKSFIEGRLKKELEEIVTHLKRGMRRRDVLKWWAERWKIEEIEIFSSLMIQAEETGASMGKTLRDLAERVREERFTSVEKKASELPVKLLFPLFLIFGSVMMVIFAIIIAQIWGVV